MAQVELEQVPLAWRRLIDYALLHAQGYPAGQSMLRDLELVDRIREEMASIIKGEARDD